MSSTTKLTPAAMDRFIQAIQLGSTIAMACKYAGFSKVSYYSWVKKAQTQPDSVFSEFRDRVEEAKGKAVVGWLAKIEKAASEGSWQAAAWKLERRYPEDYGRRVQELRHTGQVDTGPDVEQMAQDIAKRIWERRNRPADVE